MRSVMEHSFSKAPQVSVPRSAFNRSHGLKTTFDADYLVPILIDEALPGDTINLNMSAFARLNTPLFPIIDNMFLETFFFAVPNRLLWDNWQKFCGEQVNPGDSIAYTIPAISSSTTYDTTTATDVNALMNYMGLPYKISVDLSEISALPLRAYYKIWNEWFRDENLQNSLTEVSGDGPDNNGYALKKRGKRHDYFTSCLPWPQKGDAVELPLGTSADINYDQTSGNIMSVYSTNHSEYRRIDSDGIFADLGGAASGTEVTKLYADLTTATAATINQLLEAFQIQSLLVRDARGGTRYTEILRSHFGVTSPDMRVQRPEFLGGGRSIINITPIAQTSETGVTEQGNLSAIGTVSAQGHGFTKSFTEHCIIIGLANVRADITYQQGLERQWSRSTRYDYYWPALAHLGEQAVLNQEIYYQNTAADDNVFGYIPRYDEYRFKPSRITGQLQSAHATSLDAWHLSEEFSSLPTLGATFVQSNTPLDRAVATPAEPHFLADFYFSMKHIRPMPTFGTPASLARF